MKTDELVTLLANRVAPVKTHVVARRFAIALGLGMFAAAAAMVLLLGLRPDIADAMHLPMFWMKVGFPASVATVALFAAARLARPGMRLGHTPEALTTLVAAVWILAVAVLLKAVPAERDDLIFGGTWLFCVLTIPLLSIPLLAAAMWAMKGLAPTRLSLAGGAAGLLAGSASAAIYALHCPETGAPFLATWYVLGMFIPAAVGALIGPRVLHW